MHEHVERRQDAGEVVAKPREQDAVGPAAPPHLGGHLAVQRPLAEQQHA